MTSPAGMAGIAGAGWLRWNRLRALGGGKTGPALFIDEQHQRFRRAFGPGLRSAVELGVAFATRRLSSGDGQCAPGEIRAAGAQHDRVVDDPQPVDSAAGLQRVARRILGKRIQPSLHQAAFVAVERADWKQAAGLRPRELRLFCGTGPRAAGLYGAIQPYQGEEAPHGLCPAVCGGLLFI